MLTPVASIQLLQEEMPPSLPPLGFTSICYCTFSILAGKSQASALMTEVQGGAVQGSQNTVFVFFPDLFYTIIYPQLYCGECWLVC